MKNANKTVNNKAQNTTAKAQANAPVNSAIVQARANVAAKALQGVGVTLHTNGQPIKGLAPITTPIKPTRYNMQFISAIKGHPGKGNCVKRFHLYKVGMTLLHCKATAGLVVNDVTFYAQNGYLTLSPCTDEQLAKALAAWEKATKGEQQVSNSKVA